MRSKDLAIQDQRGNMVLHYAVSPHTTQFMLSSLIMGMDLDDLGRQNNRGETVLHKAAAEAHNENVISLLLALMSPDHLALRDQSGAMALDRAIVARQDVATMTKWISKTKPEDLGVQAENTYTILHRAVSKYISIRFDALQDELYLPENRSAAVMRYVLLRGHLQFLKLIVERMRPEDIVLRDMNGHTAFDMNGGLDLEKEMTLISRLEDKFAEELGLEKDEK